MFAYGKPLGKLYNPTENAQKHTVFKLYVFGQIFECSVQITFLFIYKINTLKVGFVLNNSRTTFAHLYNNRHYHICCTTSNARDAAQQMLQRCLYVCISTTGAQQLVHGNYRL